MSTAAATPIVGATDASAARRAADRRALRVAVGIYVGIFAMKFAVYLLTGVVALLAEALHTLSDLFISAFLLLALRIADRHADEDHAFGHGRAENVAALVAATLFVSFTSYQLYAEAIPRLFSPEEAEVRNLGLAVAVLLASAAAAAVPLVALLRRKERGAAARAQTQELINDQLGLAAALVGTLFLLAGFPIADPIAAVAIATLIAVKAVKLFRLNASLLLGRSPGDDYLDRVKEQALSVPGVVGISAVRAEFVGPEQVHAALHVVVPPETDVRAAERIADEIRRRVHEDDDGTFCVIELESATSA